MLIIQIILCACVYFSTFLPRDAMLALSRRTVCQAVESGSWPDHVTVVHCRNTSTQIASCGVGHQQKLNSITLAGSELAPNKLAYWNLASTTKYIVLPPSE